MNFTIKKVFIVAYYIGMAYLSVSFILTTFSFVEWGYNWRGLFLVLGVIFPFVSTTIMASVYDEDDLCLRQFLGEGKIAVIVFVVLYLGFCFIHWGFNPSCFHIAARVFIAAMGMMLHPAIMVITVANSGNDDGIPISESDIDNDQA